MSLLGTIYLDSSSRTSGCRSSPTALSWDHKHFEKSVSRVLRELHSPVVRTRSSVVRRKFTGMCLRPALVITRSRLDHESVGHGLTSEKLEIDSQSHVSIDRDIFL
jgi:hypothetical protein